MPAHPTTPAIAAATRAGLQFRVHEYAPDARADALALEASSKLGVPPERVFKTLVVEVDGGFVFALVPAGARLDTRALGKRAALASPEDARRVTGYVKGGTSVLGSRRALEVLLDESALEHETIVVNGGKRGVQLEVAPDDLLRVTGGRTARLGV